MSDSLRPRGLEMARLLCPFPGKNTGVGSHFLLQGIFLTQGLNPCLPNLLHWQVGSLALSQGWGGGQIENNQHNVFFAEMHRGGKRFL